MSSISRLTPAEAAFLPRVFRYIRWCEGRRGVIGLERREYGNGRNLQQFIVEDSIPRVGKPPP